MSTAEGLRGSSSPESVALGEVLAFFGTVADYAAGAPSGQAERIAGAAVGMGALAGLSQQDLDALHFAAYLRNLGALGNAAFAKGEELPERTRTMLRWDIPADGARICERITALPSGVADIVRWQSENWDGTGFPDQLRWSGISQAAGLLHIAAAYSAIPEPDDAFAAVCAESGRTFSPEHVRMFVLWFHTHGGEIDPVAMPVEALDASRTKPIKLVEMLSERVDAHNGTPLRAQRVARRTSEVAETLEMDDRERRIANLCALTFGIGEVRSPQLEFAQFDPLARLGIETRAAHAVAAAQLTECCSFVKEAAPVLRARAEWYDGTGRPDRLRGDGIPQAARVLAAVIAFDALDEAYRSRIAEERALPITRMETAAGRQFDPNVIRALATLQARA